MNIKPASRPRASKADITAKIPPATAAAYPVMLVGVRAYYRDTMGASGKNDRGIYDDAIFIIAPDTFAAYNANTDPSLYRKGIASLKLGVHLYRKGKHKINSPNGYPAFRPATKDEGLPVTRDAQGDSIGYAINIHRGGWNSTSSLGCQTIPPDQWESFRSTVYMLMDRYNQKTIPYILT